MEESRLKVLYLTNIPSPYRVDFFNELGKLCDLTVLFEKRQANGRDRTWANYEHDFFKAVELEGFTTGSDNALCISVVKYIKRNQYDVVIVGGYSTPTAMLSILIMKLKTIPFFLNADGGMIKKENIIMKQIKKFFISNAIGYLSTGEKTDEYLIYYGATEKNIYHYPFTSVNKKSILERVPTEEEKIKIKEKLKIQEENVIVSVGRFVHGKGFDILIKAMKEVQNAVLYIVGGEPVEEYKDLIRKYQLTNVKFLPFMSLVELLEYYRMADLFVLATRRDAWGLVINEAMSQGLPIITTNQCVAGIELIRDGENGFIVPVEDCEQLSSRINEIVENKALRDSMAENSLKTIREYSIEEMAKKHMEVFKAYVK